MFSTISSYVFRSKEEKKDNNFNFSFVFSRFRSLYGRIGIASRDEYFSNLYSSVCLSLRCHIAGEKLSKLLAFFYEIRQFVPVSRKKPAKTRTFSEIFRRFSTTKRNILMKIDH
jgi:hypothetical protein